MRRHLGPRKARRQGQDVYQAEDEDPVEEKQAGRRFDEIGEVQYEMPSDFSGEDEEIDEDEAFTAEDNEKYAGWFSRKVSDAEHEEDSRDRSEGEEGSYNTDDFSEEEGEELAQAESTARAVPTDDEAEEASSEDEDTSDTRHAQMLAAVTGKQASVRTQKRQRVITEAYPESEANLPPVHSATGKALTVADLVSGLGAGASKLGRVRKELDRLAGKHAPLAPALPSNIQARKRREAGYEATTEDVSKWQDQVKANREAPTLNLTQQQGPQRASTLSAITAGFQPQSAMELEIDAMLKAAGVSTAADIEAAEEALAVKTLTAEEAQDRQHALAKMRSLMLRHTDKAKHLKKIKSKDFHRRTNRAAKLKAKKLGEEGEEGYMRLAAEEAELNRARERLTLRHKNSSRWARRALKRGVDVMDAGTKEALEEQLRLGQELRRKVDRVEDRADGDDSGSSTDASDDADIEEVGADTSRVGKRAARKMREGALDILQGKDGDPEKPDKGLFSLPFMRRAMERQQAAAKMDAEAVLRELDSQNAGDGSEREDDSDGGAAPSGRAPGRFSFGGGGSHAVQQANKGGQSDDDDLSDEFEDAEARIERHGLADADTVRASPSAPAPVTARPSQAHLPSGRRANIPSAPPTVSIAGIDGRAVDVRPAGGSTHTASAPAESQQATQQISTDPQQAETQSPSTIASVQASANGLAPGNKKARRQQRRSASAADALVQAATGVAPAVPSGQVEEAEDEAGEEHIHTMQPVRGMDMSQRELIAAAFAGDDVQADFEAAKAAEAEAEAPAVEEPSQLPGWGAWASHQRKPQWLIDAKAKAQKQREEALAGRKDANMKGVIISERCDKKAAKYATSALPFPHVNRGVYERQMRQPLGADFNTHASHRDFIRPAVLKTAGVIIKPIKYSKLAAQQSTSARQQTKRGNAVINTASAAKRARKQI